MHGAYSLTKHSHGYYLILIITSSVSVSWTKKLWFSHLPKVMQPPRSRANWKSHVSDLWLHASDLCHCGPHSSETQGQAQENPRTKNNVHKKSHPTALLTGYWKFSCSVSQNQVKSSDLMKWTKTAHSKNVKHLHSGKSAHKCMFTLYGNHGMFLHLNPSEYNGMFLPT